ncbi:23S rRNA (uracil(1939)-C(5))-methyltransferase RlmD [Aureibacillus halotolerans]|uniref:23S rRNA m(5)U-1939 methyltransferase n=1 Tax=Aureibacillus halotolerans TaxID=1508390 RepID=A0A4R6TTF6_9BACI|nr:23S rRNA (uracil(1939)-C(5))-methyltransferase RlmD [Aureibacillus halotolerans]TDQ36386.1 23S rRNA m(5)U-1939 methyltransferase [Aureibacillus halotolerans]
MTNPGQQPLKQGQKFPLKIKRLGINGEGVGHYKGQTVFVKGALPGETVFLQAERIHPRFTEATLLKIDRSSKKRIEPPCPVFDVCGGCQIQHLSYKGQLDHKRDLVMQAMTRFGPKGLPLEKLIKPTVGMDDPWHYRNKSQMQIRRVNGKLLTGLYQEGSHKLVDLSHCPVQHESINAATQKVKRIVDQLQIDIYDERKHKGTLRSIVVRTGFKSGELQVVLVTKTKELPKRELLISELRKELPDMTSLVQNIQPEKTSLVMGKESVVLFGNEKVEERLGDRTYELSATAFFQLNPIQTEKLYNEVSRVASLTGTEKVADLYCGVGTIGLWLAKKAGEVRGMDITTSAIDDARKNATKNGVKNAVYETGTPEEWLKRWRSEGWKPDVVVMDPPRTGAGTVVPLLLKERPKQIIYVSCNPSTLAKDLNALSEAYSIKSMQPLDMFPQTAQVECVVELNLYKKTIG